MRRFIGVCIITRDVPRLRDFYREALHVEPEGEGVFVAFSSEGCQLSLFHDEGMEQMAPGSMVGAGRGACALEFEVEDVDKEYERLRELGIPIVKPPTTQPWGLRSVWFRDPDGNIVNFCAHVAGG